MAEPNIVLTGFMATGKTTVGKLLAKHLNYNFVDTDEMIVKRAGMPVSEIFRTKGEPAFRRMESDLAKELAKKKGLVISTGGGMMLDPDNASVLSKTGQIFCLVATPKEIFDRVSKATQANRPLLESEDPMKQVTQLLAQREKGYKKFTQIKTSQRTPEEITVSLVSMIRANSDLSQ